MKLQYLAEDELLYFMHIMKTAGTSVNVKILNNIERNKTSYYPKYVRQKQINKVTDKKLNSFMYLTGHYDWRPLDRIAKEMIAFTILRDPIKRTISLYKQLKFNYSVKEHRGKEKKIQKFFLSDKNSFKDFVFNDEILCKRIINMQTRTIASTKEFPYKHNLNPEVLISGNMLEHAIKNIEKFSFVGIVERMQETMLLLNYYCGFKPINDITAHNVSKEKEKIEIDSETLDRLNKYLELDYKLYDYVSNLMDEQLKHITYESTMNNYVNVMYEVKRICDFKDIRRNQILYVRGWHTEEDKKHWTGDDTISEIDFSLEKVEGVYVSFKIINCLDENILRSLKIKVNGIDIKFTYSYVLGSLCEFRISKDIIKLNRKLTTISIIVDKTISPSELGLSDDYRSLGIQISNFKIGSNKIIGVNNHEISTDNRN